MREVRARENRRAQKDFDTVLFGRTVRELRGRQGVSQEELGERADIHRNYVGAVERGEIRPGLPTMVKLARGLGLPVSTLWRYQEDRARDSMRERGVDARLHEQLLQQRRDSQAPADG